MNREKIIENMIDQVKEAQLKLGYVRETMFLYYPIASLNAVLETQITEGRDMLAALKEAFRDKRVLGRLAFELHGDRIAVEIPPEGVEYVHQKVKEPEFLAAVVALFQENHHCSLEEIKAVFERYEGDYICKKVPPEMGFDYVMYFREPSIDAYYYCIKEEMGHTIYHRFTAEDYRILARESGAAWE